MKQEMLKFRALNEIVAELFVLHSLDQMDEMKIYTPNEGQILPAFAYHLPDLIQDRGRRVHFLKGLILNDYEQAIRSFGENTFSKFAERYIEEVNYQRILLKEVIKMLDEPVNEAAAKTK